MVSYKTIWKNTLREIGQSFGRFAAIMAIVGLGVGLFSGLKVTQSAMTAMVQKYLDDMDFYDYRLLSTYGFEQEDVDFLRANADAEAVEGALCFDALYRKESGDEGVARIYSLTEHVNGVKLLDGRMPQAPGECLVDSNLFRADVVGQKLALSQDNDEDTLEHFAQTEYTIVGRAQSSLYIQFERGNTSLGTGRVDGFVYLTPAGFDEDYYTELYVKFAEDMPLYSDAYKDFLKEKEAIWEDLTTEAAERRYGRLKDDADAEYADALEEFETKKADAKKELDDAAGKLADARTEIDDANGKLADAEQELADAKKKLKDAKKTLAEKEQELADGERKLADGEQEWYAQSGKLAAAKSDLQKASEEIAAQEALLQGKKEELAAAEYLLQAGLISPEEIAAGKAALEEAQAQIEAGKAQIEAAYAQLSSGDIELAKGWNELRDAEKEIDDGKKALQDARKELADGERELADGEKELADAREEVADGEKELADAEKEYEDGLAEYETKIADAQKELDDAREEIDSMEHPDVYVLGRDTNVGYVCFESDSGIVDGIANVFPIFFFLVAALVCVTTMNRMVEEQRTQIGVLKALGYGEAAIMLKYVFYSGSAALLGCVLGFFGGTYVFPKVIWYAYQIMYNVGEIGYVFDGKLAVISVIVSLLCSVGTTWLSCRMELSQVAAQLMRPKAPKAGKRVLMERIPFVWKRLSFLRKVSVRNIFRYKKRLFMMVLGISGCTALLVTGFGINDSIAEVANQQYEEIQIYDVSVTLADDLDEEMEEKLAGAAGLETEDALVSEWTRLSEKSMDIVADGGRKSIYVVTFEDGTDVTPYLDLHTVENGKIVYPGPGEAVLSQKIADTYGIAPGDIIVLEDDDLKRITATVTGINKNFIYNYVYLSASTYTEYMGEEPEYRSLYLNVTENADLHHLSAALMGVEGVANVTVNEDMLARFKQMMSSLNLVVVVVIICAALLAFIVLYNLTNINITERVREIATIKVLGFYRNETAAYVFRENTVLTLFGALPGLLLGKWLHSFVMSQIKVDVVTFDVRILAQSYLYSFLLTFVFSWFVNRLMGGKLEKISMTESLKSVD